MAEGVDLPMAKRKFSMETARLLRTSASMVSSSWWQDYKTCLVTDDAEK
jgi:hypothetical protein